MARAHLLQSDGTTSLLGRHLQSCPQSEHLGLPSQDPLPLDFVEATTTEKTPVLRALFYELLSRSYVPLQWVRPGAALLWGILVTCPGIPWGHKRGGSNPIIVFLGKNRISATRKQKSSSPNGGQPPSPPNGFSVLGTVSGPTGYIKQS